MNPQNVRPEKFNIFTIIYEDTDFTVAYGIYENEKEPRLAMRWNGWKDAIGYPSQGGHPLWFQLPNTGIWTHIMLEAIDKINAYEDRIEKLKKELH